MIYAIVFVVFFSGALSAVLPPPEYEIVDNYIGVPTVDGYQLDNGDEVETRIKGGKPARPGQIPYQVGLFMPSHPGAASGSWCGGTLISNQYILTAAHCIVKKNNVDLYESAYVLIGATNRINANEKGQRRFIVPKQNFIKHPGYNNSKLTHDIAIIKLPTTVELNEFVQTAELPSRTQSRANLVGKNIVSSGWGLTGGHGTSQATVLQYIYTTVDDGNSCIRAFGSRLYNNNAQVCINAPGKSVCAGDSGGPHVIKESGKNIVIGVTSYGYLTCDVGYPQVLTRVEAYLDWINQNTGIPIKNEI